eukprot:8900186-Lingulodinium_polyedra.AAC.1
MLSPTSSWRPRRHIVRSLTYACRETSESRRSTATSQGSSNSRRTKTARAHPGKMPLVGLQAAPS